MQWWYRSYTLRSGNQDPPTKFSESAFLCSVDLSSNGICHWSRCCLEMSHGFRCTRTGLPMLANYDLLSEWGHARCQLLPVHGRDLSHDTMNAPVAVSITMATELIICQSILKSKDLRPWSDRPEDHQPCKSKLYPRPATSFSLLWQRTWSQCQQVSNAQHRSASVICLDPQTQWRNLHGRNPRLVDV